MSPESSVSNPVVLFAALLPHAPILIPAVGGGRKADAQASIVAMDSVARRLIELKPEAVVLISPHSPRRSGEFGVWGGARLQGTFESFGAAGAGVDVANDVLLAAEIGNQARLAGLNLWDIPNGALDHGALVPLWHLANQGWAGPTVVLGLNYPGEGGLIELGQSIRRAAGILHRQIAVVASGDMSHRLKPHAPAGYHPRAVDFDQAFIGHLRSGVYRDLLEMDPALQELAAEDAVDSTLIASSAVDWNSQGHEVLSYEGPFGVGYGVAILFDSQTKLRGPEDSLEDDSDRGNLLPGIARASVIAALGGGADRIPGTEGLYLRQRRGVFVTIRTRKGDLRGCVGTLEAKYPNLVEETWQLARDAAFRDHRFPPIQAAEIPELVFEVSVMGPLEPVNSPADLDPQRWGLVVSAEDGRRGTLLPGISEIKTAAEQLELTRRKAGIHGWESVILKRFSIRKFVEPTIVKTEA